MGVTYATPCIRKESSPNCDTCNLEENNLHMFYFCKNNKLLVQYLRELLQKCLKQTNLSMIKLLFFDTSGLTQKDGNTTTTLVTSFYM